MSRQLWRLGINFLIGLVLLNIVVLTVKDIVKRPRPTSILKDYSFPSQHSANAFYVAAYLAAWPWWRLKKERVLNRYIVIGLYLIAFFVAYSRIYLKVHYFSDVLAGGIIGWLSAKINYNFLNDQICQKT